MNQPATPLPQEGSSLPPPPAYSIRITQPENRPVVVYTLMGLTIIVFILQTFSAYIFGLDVPASWGAMIRGYIVAGQYWRLITPVLLHGSLIHIGFNLYALYVIGPGVEKYYGHWRFLALYLLGGLAGNVASFILSKPNIESIGASTAIFGLLAAQGIFIYHNRKLYGQRSRALLSNIIMIAVVNLILGVSLSSVIDNWGHLGGLVGGLLFALLAGPVYEVAGTPPVLHLEDTRQPLIVQLAALGEFVLIAALAFYFITTHNFPVL
jgi:rhomboid protease GluP